MEGVYISRMFEQCPRFACTKKVVNNNPPEFLQKNKELTLVRIIKKLKWNNNNNFMAAIAMTINDDGTNQKIDYLPLFPWAKIDEP
jgi:uncharacterized protein (UPF0179 family)